MTGALVRWGNSGHKQVQREDDEETQRKDGHPQAKERGLE